MERASRPKEVVVPRICVGENPPIIPAFGAKEIERPALNRFVNVLVFSVERAAPHRHAAGLHPRCDKGGQCGDTRPARLTGARCRRKPRSHCAAFGKTPEAFCTKVQIPTTPSGLYSGFKQIEEMAASQSSTSSSGMRENQSEAGGGVVNE